MRSAFWAINNATTCSCVSKWRLVAMEHKIVKFLIQTNSCIFLSGLVTLSWYLEEVNGSWSRVCQLKPRVFFVFVAENSKFLITKEGKSESRVPSKIFKVEPPSGNMQTSFLLLFLIVIVGIIASTESAGGSSEKTGTYPRGKRLKGLNGNFMEFYSPEWHTESDFVIVFQQRSSSMHWQTG